MPTSEARERDFIRKSRSPSSISGIAPLASSGGTFPSKRCHSKHSSPADPRKMIHLIRRFGGLRLYQSWRSAILRMILAHGGGSQEDHWKAFGTYGRIAGIKTGLSDIQRPLERAFGTEISPPAIPREMALEAESQATGAGLQGGRPAVIRLSHCRSSAATARRRNRPAGLGFAARQVHTRSDQQEARTGHLARRRPDHATAGFRWRVACSYAYAICRSSASLHCLPRKISSNGAPDE